MYVIHLTLICPSGLISEKNKELLEMFPNFYSLPYNRVAYVDIRLITTEACSEPSRTVTMRFFAKTETTEIFL